MKAITAKFTFAKETKGAVQYTEEGPEDKQAVRTLYLRKTATGEEIPQQLVVTIKEA